MPQFVEFWEFCLKAFTVRAVSQCGQWILVGSNSWL
jgi:hypothetical protein